MNQQINLYQPMFRKQKVMFSAVTMLQVSVFFLLLFATLYVYQLMKLKPYEKQLESLGIDLTQLRAQVAVIESKKAGKGKSKLIENEIAKLSKELEQRERIMKVLSNKSFGNSTGFSAYLESFARKHVSGTWLTDVSIRQGGSSLGLKGKTLSSELVPVYIQQLADEKSMQGSSFNVMELSRVETEEGKSELNFLISTN